MADCKECIKNDVCELYIHLHCKDYAENKCKFFKNKADFVEVPCRCSECQHLEIINKEPVYAECKKQKLTFLLWQADTREHFCSYGKPVNYESSKTERK